MQSIVCKVCIWRVMWRSTYAKNTLTKLHHADVFNGCVVYEIVAAMFFFGFCDAFKFLPWLPIIHTALLTQTSLPNHSHESTTRHAACRLNSRYTTWQSFFVAWNYTIFFSQSNPTVQYRCGAKSVVCTGWVWCGTIACPQGRLDGIRWLVSFYLVLQHVHKSGIVDVALVYGANYGYKRCSWIKQRIQRNQGRGMATLAGIGRNAQC